MGEVIEGLENELRQLDAHRTSALMGDAKGVHQFRRSLRSIRAWLRMGDQRELESELAWVSNELSPLRDLDVLDEALNKHTLRSSRPQAIQQAVFALNSERWRKARAALNSVSAPSVKDGEKRLKELEKELEKFKLKDDAESLQSLRRIIRRIVVTRKWLGQTTEDLDSSLAALSACCDLLMIERFSKANG
ncbi:MAG: CHAD domain-containing protein [Archangium sp.]